MRMIGKLNRRTNCLIVGAVAVLGGLGAWQFAARTARHGPFCVTDRPWLQVVVGPKDTSVSTCFRLRNEGDQPLVFGKITTSCGCLDATLGATELQSKASTTLRVKAATPSVGERTVEIRIASNDRLNGEISLHLTIDRQRSLPYVLERPQAVSLGAVTNGSTEATFVIQCHEAATAPPWISSAISSVDGLRVRVVAVEERFEIPQIVLRKYRCLVSYDAQTASAGTIAGAICLATGAGESTVDEIPVSVRVLPPVFALPSALCSTFGVDETERSVRVAICAPDGSSDFVVVPVPDGAHRLRVRQVSNVPGQVSFEITPLDRLEDIDTRIQFRTNHPRVEKVIVPVWFRFAKS
jgi:hypothetical protein